MCPDRAFYDLQVRFARSAARLAGVPLAAALLLARVERVHAFADLLACFPLQALAVHAPVAVFQQFLDLDA